MTMKVTIINDGGDPKRSLLVTSSDGTENKVLPAGYHTEVWIHSGKDLQISEKEEV